MKQTCGNCKHWMKKSDCPREAKYKPSANATGCSSFEADPWKQQLHEQQQAEEKLAIQNQIQSDMQILDSLFRMF